MEGSKLFHRLDVNSSPIFCFCEIEIFRNSCLGIQLDILQHQLLERFIARHVNQMTAMQIARLSLQHLSGEILPVAQDCQNGILTQEICMAVI